MRRTQNKRSIRTLIILDGNSPTAQIEYTIGYEERNR
jgi:hypothetical protein